MENDAQASFLSKPQITAVSASLLCYRLSKDLFIDMNIPLFVYFLYRFSNPDFSIIHTIFARSSELNLNDKN